MNNTPLFALLLVALLSLSLPCRAANVAATAAGGAWSSASTWVGGVLPQPGDSVTVAGDALTCSVKVTVDVPVTVASLVVGSTSAGCHGVVRVSPGVTLAVTGAITLDGALQLDAATSVARAASIAQGSLGLLQGFGTVDAPAVTLSGNTAPGIALTKCALCVDPFNAATAAVGTLTFTGATTMSGASVFVKALSDTQNDVLVFQKGLAFSGTMTKFLTDIASTVTAAVNFVSSPAGITGTMGTSYTVTARTAPYPWQSECLTTNCPVKTTTGTVSGKPGGGGLVSLQTTNTADGSLAAVTVDAGTSGTTSSVCGQGGGGTISVLVGPCPVSQTATCNPACVHGTCNAVLVCDCPFDAAHNFGWSGAACDAPVCTNNCGGAVAGTCTAGATLPSCVCNAPFTGALCNTIQCTPACTNGGTCVMGAGNVPVCNCPTGFTGADCSTKLAAGQCPPCGTFGQCSASGTCTCQPGWSGSSCNIPVCPGFVAGVTPNCNGNGQCSSDATPVCTCSAGWSGADCATPVCLPNACANGGTCQVSGGTTLCTCASGWGGSTCTLRTTSAGGMQPWLIGVIVVGAVLGGVLVAVGIAVIRKVQVRRNESIWKKQMGYVQLKE